MRGDAREHRSVVVEQVAYGGKALRQRGADFGRRFEDAHVVPRCGEQIGDAVPHQAAADDADFQVIHAPIFKLLSRRVSNRRNLF